MNLNAKLFIKWNNKKINEVNYDNFEYEEINIQKVKREDLIILDF